MDTIREVDRPTNSARRDLLKAGVTLMIASLWGAGPALTEEERMTDTKKSTALPAVLTYDDIRAVSPALEHYTKGPLLDGLWKRPDLSPRDRSVITVSALIARIQTIEMPFHFALALDNGVKASELSEIITHLAFYAGWANAMSAVAVAKDIFRQRGIGIDQLPPAKDKLLPLNEAAETQRTTQVSNNFASVSPGLVQNTTDLIWYKRRQALHRREHQRSSCALTCWEAIARLLEWMFAACKKTHARIFELIPDKVYLLFLPVNPLSGLRNEEAIFAFNAD
jgi:4-carboxymuconolactone decarboxylase